MHIATTTAPSSVTHATPVVPGAVIGTGQMRGQDPASRKAVYFDADVVAGHVVRTGVTNIQQAAMDLIASGWEGGAREHSGLVGFVRNGDAWDAVALLAPELPGGPPRQLWSLGELQALRVAPGVQLDAIWQISDYGGDMRWRAEHPMIPELR